MDIIDKKILLFLIENCRYPNSFIAKQLNISEQVVKYRIERLEKEGIISNYMTSIMQNAIGALRYYTVYLKIKKTHIAEKEAVIKFLLSNPYVIKLFECDGAWNLGFDLSSALLIDIKPILDEVQKLSKGHMEDLKVFNISLSRYLKRSPFLEFIGESKLANKRLTRKKSLSFQKELFLSKNKQFFGTARLDNIDIKILSLLRHDARIPIYQLSEKIAHNAQTTKSHISLLIKRGVIKDFTVHIGYEKLGLKKVIILFSALKSEEQQEQIIHYVQIKFPAAYSVVGYLDYWNLGFITYFKDIDEVDKMIEEIVLNFKENISDYNKIIITKDLKPEGYNINIEKIYKDAVTLLEPKSLSQ